jgi:electron transport complex protein RnfE
VGKLGKTFTNGILNENPSFKLVLGTCPTLAVTTSAINGVGMGVSTLVVLTCSNIVISMLRKFIPDKVRIPAFITVIAAFVTIVQMLLKAFVPALDKSLGIYIPLIVVNCIILARAEAFASKYPIGQSAMDGLGMGVGFTIALTLIGAFREILGNGSIFNLQLFGENNVFGSAAMSSVPPMLMMILPPGGFIAYGLIMAWANKMNFTKIDMKKKVDIDPHNNSDCGACALAGNCPTSALPTSEDSAVQQTGSTPPADSPEQATDTTKEG